MYPLLDSGSPTPTNAPLKRARIAAGIHVVRPGPSLPRCERGSAYDVRQRLVMRIRPWLSLVGCLVSISPVVGCSSTDDGDESASELDESSASAVLDVHALDLWAQPLPTSAKVSVSGAGAAAAATRIDESGKLRVLLGDPGELVVHVEADQHEPLDVKLAYDGQTVTLAGDRSKTAGTTLGHTSRAVGGRDLAAHDLYIGLRHKWFSAEGRPARRGNLARLMMDGEEAWGTVTNDLATAKKQVLASTWWWESDFRPVRGALEAPRADLSDTILAKLEASPAEKRVIVGQFQGQVSLTSWMTSDWRLRSHASDPRFQFMRRGNDTRGKFRFEVKPFSFADRVKANVADAKGETLEADAIESTVPGHDVDLSQMVGGGAFDMASYHQKYMVMDGDRAFVGGMNLRNNDWDTSDHLVYDARRLGYLAQQDQIDQVVSKQVQAPVPRKDYMVRIEGPSAVDVADVFKTTWDDLLASPDVADAPGRTPFEVDRSAKARADGIQMQVTATMPRPGKGEHAIAETWFNAVRNAERFIYVEDQYFRVPMLHDAIARRMDEKPELKLVVITMESGKLDPACLPSRQAYDFFAKRYPERATFLTLRSFDPSGRASQAYVDIDVHSKMLIVDDTFMSVGSANKNNRGIVYEYELNVAVADRAWVTDARRRILKNLGLTPSDDVSAWYAEMRSVAAANDATYAAWKADNKAGLASAPRGFVFGLRYEDAGASCTFQSVGPDST